MPGCAKRECGCRACVSTLSGLAVGLTGLGFVGVGLRASREVVQGLARERIVSTPDSKPPNAPVRSGAAARSLAESIRRATLESAGGRTYSEVDLYVAADGGTTSDSSLALVDERTGKPVQSPDAVLWIQSTTLQTALMQAYLASRLAVLSVGVGAVLVAAGAGIAAAGASRR